MTTPLHPTSSKDTSTRAPETPTPDTNKSRKLLIALSTAIALHMSPVGAQTDSTRILEKGELPRAELVKKGDTHTDTKPGMNGKIYTVTSTVQTSSPSASLQGTKGYGQVVDTPYGKLSFAEIQGHEKRDEILDDIMTPEQQKEYSTWKKGMKEMANQEGKKLDAELITKKDEGRKLDAELITKKDEGRKLDSELITKYYAYVANIEAGASGEREVLNKILEKDFTPTDLKKRIMTLLNSKDTKIALK